MTWLVRLGDVATIRPGLNTGERGYGLAARPGEWRISAVRIGDIQDDRLVVDQIESLEVEPSRRVQAQLLRPYDVLVSARWSPVKVALVPPDLTEAVADANLLVVHLPEWTTVRAPGWPTSLPREYGMFLWWFLTSQAGRRQVESLMVRSTVTTLTAGTLAEVVVPLPAPQELVQLAEIIEVSERAYTTAIEAAQLRRTAVRDAIINRLQQDAAAETPGEHD